MECTESAVQCCNVEICSYCSRQYSEPIVEVSTDIHEEIGAHLLAIKMIRIKISTIESTSMSQNDPWIVVFDMDNTMVFNKYVGNSLLTNDTDLVRVSIGTKEEYYKCILRPHLVELLEFLVKHDVVIYVFTAARKELAERVVEFLDKDKKYFYGETGMRLLHRDACDHIHIKAEGIDFKCTVKDLRLVHPCTSRVMLVDDTVVNAAYQPGNLYPISNFDGTDMEDKELVKLKHFIDRMLKRYYSVYGMLCSAFEMLPKLAKI